MKKYILILLTLSGIAIANLPPTSSKGDGEANFSTTFNTDFDTIPLTRNGTTITIGTIPISKGGTGSTVKNFVDLSTNQTVGGVKTFTDGTIGNITGNASTVTTNANLTGDVTSIGNTTSYNNVVPVAKGGTNSSAALGNGKTIYSNSGAIIESTVEHKDLIRSLSGGVVTGGVVSINADTTKFDVSAGFGLITDNWTDPLNPIVYNVSWPTLTGNTTTYLLSDTFSYVGINNTGSIAQYNSTITNEQRRDIIVLAKLAHTNLTTIQNVVNNYDAIQSPIEQLRDMIESFGYINTGNTISPNGANLNINKSAGVLFGKGVNYPTNLKNPNTATIAAQSPVTFQYRTQTGASTANTTNIIPGSYDNAGTVTAVGGGANASTNQRVYLFPNGNVRIQYGQVVHSNLAAAIQAIGSESFVVFPNIRESAALIGIISLTKNATSLNDTSQAVFIPVSKLGEFNVGSSGVATTTLQQAYNNSVSPQITTDATLGPVDLRNGGATNTSNVFRIQNIAGTSTLLVDGSGNLTANSLDLVTPLPITEGGTGASTKSAAFDALSPMTTGGDIIYGGTSGTGTRLANGTSGQFLKSNGGTSPPSWASATSTATITAKTGSYALTSADQVVYWDTSSGAGTATLPNASGNTGLTLTVDLVTAGNGLTINTTSSQAIGHISSGQIVMTRAGDSLSATSDGSNWVINNLTTGKATAPGLFRSMDIFGLTFGNSNATTACASTPCGYLDQTGSGAVNSVTRSGTGMYAINAARTYIDFKCSEGGLIAPGVDNAILNSSVSCENCASLSFAAVARTTGNSIDVAGTFLCIGTY